VAQTSIARNPTEAMLMAQQMGFPVAMKINSPQVTHKSDVGGVRLGLSNGQVVRAAYSGMMSEVHKHVPDATLDGVVIEPMVSRPHAREVLKTNLKVLHLVEGLGFHIEPHPDDDAIKRVTRVL
jgi:acetyltransferase